MERKHKAALEEDLKIQRRDQVKMKEALNNERKEKYALSKALRKERAQKDSLLVEVEYRKIKMTDQKEMITKLKCELQSVENRKEELKLTNRKKDREIQSLHLSIENLQCNIEAKGNTISILQEKDTQLTSDLKEEQSKNVKLQRDYEAAVSQQQQRDKLKQVRLTGELEDAQYKSLLAEMQHQDVRETCRMLEEKLVREKAEHSRAIKKVVKQRKVSAATEDMEHEMETLRIENTNIRCKFEALEAKYDFQNKGGAPCQTESKTRQDQHQDDIQRAILEERVNQTASALERERERADQTAIAFEKEREILHQTASALESERERADQTAIAFEKEREILHQTASALERQRDRLNQTTSALERERERADQTFIALEKERATSEKCNVKLNEALVQHTKTQEEHHRLAVDLQMTQNKLKTQGQTKVALHKATDALHSFQKEHIDLEIHSFDREALKSHSTLQISYERLDLMTGEPLRDFNGSKLNLDWSKICSSFHNS